jgi:hypothetical protein
MCHDRLGVFTTQVSNGRTPVRLFHHGSHRHADNQIVAGTPMTTLSPAVSTALSALMWTIPQVNKCRQPRISSQHDAAAIPAITSVGTAFRNILLSAKAHTPVPTSAGFHLDFRFIYEHETRIFGWKRAAYAHLQLSDGKPRRTNRCRNSAAKTRKLFSSGQYPALLVQEGCN